MIPRFSTRYSVSGAGPALVLIHGVGLARAMWEPALPRLEQRFTVIRYDLIGHGDTPAIGPSVTLHDFVEQLRALLDQLNVARAHILGFSLGGIVARGWAATYPHRTDRLVVLCSIAPRSAEQRQAIAGRLQQLEVHGVAGTIDAAIERWFTSAFIARRPDVIARTRAMLLAAQTPGYPAAYRFFATADDVIDGLEARIDCPLLAITAEDDVGSTPEMSARIAAQARFGRVHVVPALKHMAVVEAPCAVLDPIIRFLAPHGPEAFRE